MQIIIHTVIFSDSAAPPHSYDSSNDHYDVIDAKNETSSVSPRTNQATYTNKYHHDNTHQYDKPNQHTDEPNAYRRLYIGNTSTTPSNAVPPNAPPHILFKDSSQMRKGEGEVDVSRTAKVNDIRLKFESPGKSYM